MILFAAFLAILACEKTPSSDTSTPEAPTSITLSPTSFTPAQEGGNLSLTITSPARPKVNGLPDWITLTDGTYKDFKITVGLTVAANDTYQAREATMRVTASGASDVTFTVKQEGKTVVPDPTPGTNDSWKM